MIITLYLRHHLMQQYVIVKLQLLVLSFLQQTRKNEDNFTSKYLKLTQLINGGYGNWSSSRWNYLPAGWRWPPEPHCKECFQWIPSTWWSWRPRHPGARTAPCQDQCDHGCLLIRQEVIYVLHHMKTQWLLDLLLLIRRNSMQSVLRCTDQVNLVSSASFGSSYAADTKPLLEL